MLLRGFRENEMTEIKQSQRISLSVFYNRAVDLKQILNKFNYIILTEIGDFCEIYQQFKLEFDKCFPRPTRDTKEDTFKDRANYQGPVIFPNFKIYRYIQMSVAYLYGLQDMKGQK